MSKSIDINGKVDLNEFVSQAAAAAKTLDASTALIMNNSGKAVAFYCYNGGDLVKAVPFSKPLIAAGYSGLLSAGGTTFKVYPDNKADTEFIVKPHKAYVYEGPGKITSL